MNREQHGQVSAMVSLGMVLPSHTQG
jgi:hypothetical protein